MERTYLLFFFVFDTSSYICRHQGLPKDTIQTGFSSLSSGQATNMKISWQNTEVEELVPRDILSNISTYIHSNLLVKHAGASIHLSRNCPSSTTSSTDIQPNSQTDTHYCVDECANLTTCGLAPVPDEHLGRCYVCVADGKRCGFTVGSILGQGIQSHLVVYLTRRKVERCEVDPIQASACQVSPVYKRPIAGYINICPDHDILTEDLENVLLHQLFHIMGISQNLFNDRDNGYLGDISSLSGITHSNAYRTSEKAYVGRKSMEFIRNHFGCDKGYGVLLENQDIEHSHVEERLFRGEGMTVNVTAQNVFSDLTFTMLEDTGWYIPGWAMMAPFPGKSGCTILDRSCGLWVLEQTAAHNNIYPFCGAASNDYTCNTDYSSVRRCQRKSYSLEEVPNKFQYHEVTGISYEAGPYEYSDFCMLFSDDDGYSCNKEPAQLINSNNLYLERHDEDAMCVLHDGAWDINGSGRSKGAGCYSICCRENNFDIIDTNQQAHSCYQPKQTVHVSSPNNNIRGSLQCPDIAAACVNSGRVPCTTAGKCMTPSITNGQVYSSQGMYQVTIGTTLSYLCFDGYVMKGSSSSVCLGNNRFSDPAPQCSLPCKDPLVQNGRIVKSSASQSLIGDALTVKCDTDFVLDGSSVLTCTLSSSPSLKFGYWSPGPPVCVKGYLEWSGWGPCSVSCGARSGERIRTRICSTCADFEWERGICFANKTCQPDKIAPVQPETRKEGTTVILISVFGVFFLFAIGIIIFIVWFFNKAQQSQAQRQMFNESYYFAQKNPKGRVKRPRSMDLSSEYSVTSGSMKQLFVTPPGTPHSLETKITSKSSEESVIDGSSFHIPKVKYKNRARVFPKTRNPIYPPSYRDSLTTIPARQDVKSREDHKAWASPADQRAQDAAKMRANILAARNRVRNHPSFKRLVVPYPFDGESYNPNRIPFEIEEREEDNYLEDSWDRRHQVGGLQMILSEIEASVPEETVAQQQECDIESNNFIEEDLDAADVIEEQTGEQDGIGLVEDSIEEIMEIPIVNDSACDE